MPYITSDYYLTDYGGAPSDGSINLESTIKRASDVIDSLTGFKLKLSPISFELQHPFIQDNVKKATAAMVEYYILKGGYELTISGEEDNVKIGAFSYSMKTSNSGSGSEVDVPNNVVRFLSVTGLLYAGVNTASGGVYYEN